MVLEGFYALVDIVFVFPVSGLRGFNIRGARQVTYRTLDEVFPCRRKYQVRQINQFSLGIRETGTDIFSTYKLGCLLYYTGGVERAMCV
jgi:hypothetical protein